MSATSRWTTVLWDMDGTIIDASVGIMRRIEATLARFGIAPPTPEQLPHWIGPPLLSGFRDNAGMTQSEAAEAVAIMLSLVAPYTTEDMWARLGHQPCVARAGWPAVDEALLVDDTVTCVLQVAGKVRGRIDVSPTISEDELRVLALADDGVVSALAGRDIRTVIVRAPKLVNIVPA